MFVSRAKLTEISIPDHDKQCPLTLPHDPRSQSRLELCAQETIIDKDHKSQNLLNKKKLFLEKIICRQEMSRTLVLSPLFEKEDCPNLRTAEKGKPLRI